MEGGREHFTAWRQGPRGVSFPPRKKDILPVATTSGISLGFLIFDFLPISFFSYFCLFPHHLPMWVLLACRGLTPSGWVGLRGW